jgi:hypothetical protein
MLIYYVAAPAARNAGHIPRPQDRTSYPFGFSLNQAADTFRLPTISRITILIDVLIANNFCLLGRVSGFQGSERCCVAHPRNLDLQVQMPQPERS